MSKRIDLTGQRFGYWTVLEYDKESKWICKCDCGTIKSVNTVSLRKGTSTSCGCYKILHSRENNGTFINEIGNRYGKLVVVEKGLRPENNTHIFWKCKCDCGNEIEVNG